MLVDEFLRFNNVPESHISHGISQLNAALQTLGNIYDFQPNIVIVSDFMSSDLYKIILQEIKEEIIGLEKALVATVPPRYRSGRNPLEYPLNELACVQYMIRQGIRNKLGPSKEKTYDMIMNQIGMDAEFSYLIDAYALGTRTSDAVIHYIPTSRGGNNGQRILLADPQNTIRSKIMMGPEPALKYLLKVSSVAASRIGNRAYCSKHIAELSGKKLKRKTLESVFENIICPYRETSNG